jgi:hypothetical protein
MYMNMIQLSAILVLALFAQTGLAQVCYTSEVKMMDVLDKDVAVRIAVIWSDTELDERRINLIKQGESHAFIGSGLNCTADSTPTCALDHDGGLVQVLRFTEAGGERLKLILRKGELYVGSFLDNNESVLTVDQDTQDMEILLKRSPRSRCPAVRVETRSAPRR